MHLNWQARLEQDPSLCSFDNWPIIDALSLPRDKRRQFLRNQRILCLILEGRPLKEIEIDYHFSSGRLTHFMNRCLGGDSEEAPPLTKALIPGFRIKKGQRRAPLATLTVESGSAYAFEHLLATAPGLKIYLDKLLRRFCNRNRKSQNLRVKTFHKAALRHLRKMNWSPDHYPFTTENQGYQGARRYFHRRLDELKNPPPPKRNLLPAVRPIGIFEQIEIDEHTVDAESGIVLVINKMWEPLRVSRISLIACRDVGSNTVLARQLVLSRHVCKTDILMLFAQISTAWQPRELCSPGLKWPHEPYMPSQLGEAFMRPTLGIIRLDNALVHLANSVRHHVCSVVCATLNMGLPRYPTARVLIESVFKDLNLTVHRLPSTTGSYPTDPLKEPSRNRKHVPEVSLKTVEEMIDLHIAQMNSQIMGNLGAQSPINVMRSQMALHLVPLRPYCILGKENPGVLRETVLVHAEKGVRREPWINFLYVRYDRPGILPVSLIGSYVTIEYHIDAISHVKAFTKEGDFLGELSAPKTWLRFEHSVVTRKYIMRLVKAEKIRGLDPFGEYYDYLLAHRDAPSCALEIVRLGRELNTTQQKYEPETDIPPPPKDSDTDELSEPNIPDWHTAFKNRRGTANG